MAMADIKSVMAFAKKGPVKPGPMGSIGYCLGGAAPGCRPRFTGRTCSAQP